MSGGSRGLGVSGSFRTRRNRPICVLAARTLHRTTVKCNENVEEISQQMIKIFGHRGNPALFADNTMAGIRSGAAVCDGVELDFRRAASGELVLSHDPDVAGLVVADTSVQGLRTAHADLATAEDLFAADLDTSLDLEVKNSPFEPGFESDHRIALEVAERARTRDLLTSFYWPTVDAVRASFPNVHTGLLFDGSVDWRMAIQHAFERGHQTIAPHHTLIDAEMVEAAEEASLLVATWTVNDRDRVIELADLGVGTIITNTPTEAVGWIQEYTE